MKRQHNAIMRRPVALNPWWADREQDLLAEIARLRGALRAVQMHTDAGSRLASTHLSITPEDMKE